MPYPQSPDFQGVIDSSLSGNISFPAVFPNVNLYPGLEENEDQDFPNDVVPSVSGSGRYYAYPRRRVVRR